MQFQSKEYGEDIMTMTKINRIMDMLNSPDREMQDLGISLIKLTKGERMVLGTMAKVHQLQALRNELCKKAYELGKKEAELWKKSY